MITQIFLDWLSNTLAGIIRGIPPLPEALGTAVANMEGGAETLATAMGRFDMIIPIDTLTAVLSAWVGLLGFWIAVLAFRFVLWIFGR